jgi:hypothetical protein
MSDDLVKRLRLKRERCHDLSGFYYTEDMDCQEAADRIEELKVKLAKAVKALQYYAVEALPWDDDDSLIARTTLAELKEEGRG